MLLGKRGRQSMNRTTSMTEFPPLDEATVAASEGTPPPPAAVSGGRTTHHHRRLKSADCGAKTAHFLRACSLCKRYLVPDRDIYMYRGDSAFCSLECRQQEMIQDERKHKCSLMTSN